jgi:hypothetical protein
MIELEEDAELPALAQESFHTVIEPVGCNARLQGHACRGFTNLAGRAKQPVDVLRRRAGGIGQAHDGPAHQEQFALGTCPAQLFVQQREEPPNVPVGECGHLTPGNRRSRR